MQFITRVALAALACAALAACSADDVQITITDQDIDSAIAGEAVEVPFVAAFSIMGDLDAERRAELGAVEDIIRNHMVIEAIELEDERYRTSVTIEGNIPLVFVKGEGPAREGAWAVTVSETTGSVASTFPYTLQLSTGPEFDALAAKVNGINRMLSPDPVQPVRYRVRVQGESPLQVFAGGFQEGGAYHMLSELSIAPRESATLIFKDGAYRSVSGGFLFAREE